MKAFGMIEVYSFTTAVVAADTMAKTGNIKVVAFDRNRPKSATAPAPLVMIVKIEGEVAAVRAAVEAGVNYAKEKRPDFKIIIHNDQQLLNKSLWEYFYLEFLWQQEMLV